jgi:hypothetical protein
LGPQLLYYRGTHRDLTIPIPFGIGGIGIDGIGIGIGIGWYWYCIDVIGIDPPSQKSNYKILKNRLQIRIPRPREPLIKLYKNSLLSQKSVFLRRKSNSKVLRNLL